MPKVLPIDESQFLSAFGNEDELNRCYLDLETGNLMVVVDPNILDEADEIVQQRRVDASPERYLRIPTHADDTDEIMQALSEPDTPHRLMERLKAEAVQFLQENGIAPTWR